MARSVSTPTTTTARAWPARTAIGAHWLALRLNPAEAAPASAPLVAAAGPRAPAPTANTARVAAE